MTNNNYQEESSKGKYAGIIGIEVEIPLTYIKQ